MPRYVNIITYCENVSDLKNWLLENRADYVKLTEEGELRIHKNIIGAWYKGAESMAYLRVFEEEVHEGAEDETVGWLINTPLKIWAKGSNVWEQLTHTVTNRL